MEEVRNICDLNMLGGQWRSHWGGKGGQSATPDSEKIAKNRKKSGKIPEKSGKKRENRKVSFTLSLLTDRAGYATVGGLRKL